MTSSRLFTASFLTIHRLLACLVWLMGMTSMAAAAERFFGETRIGTQAAVPIHIELLRAGDVVSGVISIPGTRFEVDGHGQNTIIGRFHGDGGTGTLNLRIDGDRLEGNFNLAGQAGVIAANRTAETAEAMFRLPVQRLDLTADEWLQDMERLEEILTNEHASPFARITRDRFAQNLSAARAAVPNLNGIGVVLEMKKLAAAIGDGHTSISLPKERPRLPLGLYWFKDGLRVVRSSAAQQDLLGTKLRTIQGVPVEELSERLRAYVPQGETEWFHRAKVPELLVDPDVLRALGFAGPSFAFAFQDGRADLVQQDFVAETTAERQVLLGSSLPLWQRHERDEFRSQRLYDGSVYVNWRSYDRLVDHVAALMQDLDSSHPSRLIIDLRDNDGGDYTIGRVFVEEVRRRRWLNRQGVLYVLIGRKTFSAAMTNAIDFQMSTEAILVGEPAGAAPNNWQEVRRFHLRNSGLEVSVSTQFYEFLPGKTELIPERIVEPAPGDWGDKIDAAVQWILRQP